MSLEEFPMEEVLAELRIGQKIQVHFAVTDSFKKV